MRGINIEKWNRQNFYEIVQILSRLLNESCLIDALRVNQFKYNKIMHEYK